MEIDPWELEIFDLLRKKSRTILILTYATSQVSELYIKYIIVDKPIKWLFAVIAIHHLLSTCSTKQLVIKHAKRDCKQNFIIIMYSIGKMFVYTIRRLVSGYRMECK